MSLQFTDEQLAEMQQRAIDQAGELFFTYVASHRNAIALMEQEYFWTTLIKFQMEFETKVEQMYRDWQKKQGA